MESMRPVPDVAALPADLQTSATEWNRAADALTSRLLAVGRSYAELTYEEARSELNALLIERGRLSRRYQRALPGREYERTAGGFRFSASHRVWWDGLMRTFLAIELEHEHWGEAGQLSAHLVGWVRPDKDSDWWDLEVYCWRRAGLKGRATLAYRCCAPVLRPALEPIWDGVHPFLNRIESVVDRIQGRRK